MSSLTVDDLLAGGAQQHRVAVPAELLVEGVDSGEVLLRPLTVNDVNRIGRAARDEGMLASLLMVQQALVEPALTVEQAGRLPAGLLQFLLGEVNRISGLSLSRDEVEEAVRTPLTRAVFLLGKEFGWTPAQCSELTVGQVLLYLEMLAGDAGDGRESVA